MSSARPRRRPPRRLDVQAPLARASRLGFAPTGGVSAPPAGRDSGDMVARHAAVRGTAAATSATSKLLGSRSDTRSHKLRHVGVPGDPRGHQAVRRCVRDEGGVVYRKTPQCDRPLHGTVRHSLRELLPWPRETMDRWGPGTLGREARRCHLHPRALSRPAVGFSTTMGRARRRRWRDHRALGSGPATVSCAAAGGRCGAGRDRRGQSATDADIACDAPRSHLTAPVEIERIQHACARQGDGSVSAGAPRPRSALDQTLERPSGPGQGCPARRRRWRRPGTVRVVGVLWCWGNNENGEVGPVARRR